MLDVVFQLIVFFILVTNFAAAELPPLHPPDPLASKAQDTTGESRIVVNVMPEPDSGKVRAILVAGQVISPESLDRLTDLLKAAHQRNPHVEVNLRADRLIDYASVSPIMRAIAQTGISRVNVVALVGE